MIYRTYGSTGIEVSAIGMGGMRFENPDDPDRMAGLVQAAYDRGITYFDTAPGYGRSEEIFGLAFKEMNKTRSEKPWYVATKSNKTMPGDVRADLERSLKRLNVDQIDFYHMWCVITPDALRDRIRAGALRTMLKAREEGLVRHICMSSHMTGRQIAEALGEHPFEGVLLGYSAMNFAYREAGVEGAAKLGKGVAVMNPLGGGIIPKIPERFQFVKTREEETVVDGALRFLLNDERISVVLVGIGNEQHLDDAVRAAADFRPLSDEQVARIRASIRDAFDQLCTGCRYCDNCPEDLPIPKLMEAYNRYHLFGGDAKRLLGALRMHWGLKLEDLELDRCRQCGKCESACTQQLPICDRLEVIRKEVETELS